MRTSWQNAKNILKITFKLDKVAFFLCLLVPLVSAVKSYIGIILSAYVINSLIDGVAFTKIVIITLCGLALIAILYVLESILEKHRSINVEICVRKFERLQSQKMLTMSYELVEGPLVHNLRQKIMLDNTWGLGYLTVFYQLVELMGYVFNAMIGAIILVPLFLNKDIINDWVTPVYFIVLMIVIVFLTIFDVKINNKKSKWMEDCAGENSYLSYFLLQQNIDYPLGKDIRIYDASKIIKQSLNISWTRWLTFWTSSFTRINALGGSVRGFVTGVMQGGAYIYVVLKAYKGAINIGDMIMYATTIFTLSNTITSFINCISRFILTAKRQKSTLDFINIPDKALNGTLPLVLQGDNKHVFVFDNVSFKYQGSDEYVLKNINLTINPNEHIALVGMNGSGKSTLIKLLCRLYEPTEGKITLDGIDIREYRFDEYLKFFGVVFQDFKLFSFSLGQNIATNVTYNRDKVLDALKKSGLHDWINKLPDGLDTNLYNYFDKNGVEVSGGEAQKIAIARALYKESNFIILDEPTAALDPISEFEIYSHFNQIIGNKSAIFISHRLSSCKFCNEIIVLHDGKLVQMGNHDTLVSNEKGKYYELWNAQAQYYQVAEPTERDLSGGETTGC